MKISELIKELNEHIEENKNTEYEDVEVLLPDTLNPVEGIRFKGYHYVVLK